jgi:acyl transferase domain-containing protein
MNHDFQAAVVAGTNIIMDVLHQMTATKLGILSPTSTCHTFDAAADGFGRAEGITALYVKRLSDAVANGDPIRAVIRATAINTNGKGLGISQPGVLGQEAVIRMAYAKAKLDLGQTSYIECHGTGTPVGDPIEVKAIGNVFSGRAAKSPLLLSSVKSQIGHTEGASGIASIQKVVMALEEGLVPATTGIKKLNPAREFREAFHLAC